jgi:hypothetical protein
MVSTSSKLLKLNCLLVGAEGFEPPTLCSQRIAQPISLSCTDFNAVVFSGDYALGMLGHISLSRRVPATVPATVLNVPAPLRNPPVPAIIDFP